MDLFSKCKEPLYLCALQAELRNLHPLGAAATPLAAADNGVTVAAALAARAVAAAAISHPVNAAAEPFAAATIA